MNRPEKKKVQLSYTADRLTKWIGSTNSLIVHSIFFAFMATLVFAGLNFNKVMLIWNTTVSLEAIYLAIFIQMTVNKNTKDLEEVSEDIDEIQEDVEEIQEDVESIEKDVDEIQEDVENIEKDVDEIQEDVGEIEEDVDSISEQKQKILFTKIEQNLQDIMKEIAELKNKK